MQLYQRLNNEALDDDKKQNIRVIEMIKKAMGEREEAQAKPKLTPQEMARFSQAYINFKDNLENQITSGEYDEIGKHTVRLFDTLMTVIKSLDLYNKSNEDYNNIKNMLNDLIPNINEFLYLTQQAGATDYYSLEQMIRNIQDENYKMLSTEIPDEAINEAREKAQKQGKKKAKKVLKKQLKKERKGLNKEKPVVQVYDDEDYEDMPPLEDVETGELFY